MILVTGFAPFGGHLINPAQQIAERLHGRAACGLPVIGLALPVVFGQDIALVLAAIADWKPSLVLSLGLADGIPCLHLERLAVNLRRPDEGERKHPIVPDGPAAYFSTLDVDRLASAVVRAGVPAQTHSDAGSYLCNHILYQTLHHAATENLPLRAGFIHLPQSSEQAIAENKMQMASLPLDLMTAGVLAALEAASNCLD